PKTSIICSPMTSLKTSIKTITYLSDIGCLEIHGASLKTIGNVSQSVWLLLTTLTPKNPPFIMVQV
ncbi:hypothetical protein BZG24_21755, partial [Escherichia coli]|nr:hypothetical protein [Escherichia coli]